MKSIIILVMVIMLSISSSCFGQDLNEQTTIKDVNKEVQDVIRALKTFSLGQRDKAIEESKAALDKIDQRIDVLESDIDNSWGEMSEATQKKTRATLKVLRKQRTQLAEWYGGLKSSSADVWEGIKNDFSDAYKSFYDEWKKAETEFGSRHAK
ncbi:MAG: hypothetical protein GXP14_13470 [Gammaproteobacteria bacterium]|nr:hypothetical protein [Gammaproteobacteria bacterium]